MSESAPSLTGLAARRLDAGDVARIEQLRAIAQGDQATLAEFYDATHQLVFGLLLRLLNDRAVAEEVLMDVYLQVWRTAGRYDPARGAPQAWLLVLARSRALDRRRLGAHEPPRAEPVEAVGQLPAPAPGPEALAAAAEVRQTVRQALAALSAEHRALIELAYYEGLTQVEIAARLGQPLGTVKTRTRAALLRLRELLQPVAG